MKIGVAYKYSKLDWDMLTTGMSEKELIEHYIKGEQDPKRIISSHERQKRCISTILDKMPEAEIIDIKGIEDSKIKAPDLETVIAIGGDNFFQKCAYYFPDAYFVGVNSDPETSHGALLNFNIESIIGNLERIRKGDFSVEQWTKIATTVNGKMYEDTCCTLSLAIK